LHFLQTQYGNLLRKLSDRSIILVDYEYSSMNYRGFDIANHWCEYSADYSTETPHLLDFGRLPDIKEQNTFLSAYLRKQYEIEGLKN
jgi:choline/ethanolamine kinase